MQGLAAALAAVLAAWSRNTRWSPRGPAAPQLPPLADQTVPCKPAEGVLCMWLPLTVTLAHKVHILLQAQLPQSAEEIMPCWAAEDVLPM